MNYSRREVIKKFLGGAFGVAVVKEVDAKSLEIEAKAGPSCRDTAAKAFKNKPQPMVNCYSGFVTGRVEFQKGSGICSGFYMPYHT